MCFLCAEVNRIVNCSSEAQTKRQISASVFFNCSKASAEEQIQQLQSVVRISHLGLCKPTTTDIFVRSICAWMVLQSEIVYCTFMDLKYIVDSCVSYYCVLTLLSFLIEVLLVAFEFQPTGSLRAHLLCRRDVNHCEFTQRIGALEIHGIQCVVYTWIKCFKIVRLLKSSKEVIWQKFFLNTVG